MYKGLIINKLYKTTYNIWQIEKNVVSLSISSLKYWGCFGIDCNENCSITRGEKCQFSLNLHKTTTDEMSTMTFDSLMDFIGADYAVAA